ncbi:winged helix-turn-helix domain-containing protein [Pseudomonas sp. MPB26]|uniref:winged helix-turn-helix domain-containing protein n=1 Tax=Pseudomonas sp. MPB26 TaxID=3388491 RepID=UPI0039847E02
MAVMDDGVTTTSLVFGRWTLHDHGRLTGEGSDVQLPPKEWQVLRLLLVSGGALMTKDRLLELAWPQGEVAEESLTRCIYSLRKQLGVDKGFIKTIYGQGYRFTCTVNKAVHAPREYVCSVCGQVSQGSVNCG